MADVRDVRPPAGRSRGRLDRTRVQPALEMQEELLRSALGVAGAPLAVHSRPPAADALTGGMEPDEHPLAPRARLAVQSQDMA